MRHPITDVRLGEFGKIVHRDPESVDLVQLALTDLPCEGFAVFQVKFLLLGLDESVQFWVIDIGNGGVRCDVVNTCYGQ